MNLASSKNCLQNALRRMAKADAAKRERYLSGRVYFIVAPHIGLVKIGFSVDLKTRLATISACSPVPVELAASLLGGYELENDLHWRFANSRVRGEWFDYSCEIQEFVQRVNCGTTLPPIEPAPYRHVRPGLWKGPENCAFVIAKQRSKNNAVSTIGSRESAGESHE